MPRKALPLRKTLTVLVSISGDPTSRFQGYGSAKAVETFQVLYDTLAEATGTAERLRRRAGRCRWQGGLGQAPRCKNKQNRRGWWPSHRAWQAERHALRETPRGPRGLPSVSFRTWRVSTAFAERMYLEERKPEARFVASLEEVPEHPASQPGRGLLLLGRLLVIRDPRLQPGQDLRNGKRRAPPSSPRPPF